MSEPEHPSDNQVRQARPILWTPSVQPASADALSVDKARPQAKKPRGRKPAEKSVQPKLSLVDGGSSTAFQEATVTLTQRTEDMPSVRYSPTIKELPEDERPRERLARSGAHALSTAELIGILIRTGTDERSASSLGEFLLAEFGNVKGIAEASLEQLAAVRGLGPAKAAEIHAAIEFGHRLALFMGGKKPVINGPRDVANLLMPELRYLKKEVLTCCKVSSANRPGMKNTSAPSLLQ